MRIGTGRAGPVLGGVAGNAEVVGGARIGESRPRPMVDGGMSRRSVP